MNRLNLFVIPTLAVCGMLIAIDCFGTTGEDASKIHVQDFSIGFSGNYKIGSWTPVYVSLEAPTGEHLSLLLTVPDGDGVPTTTTIHYLVPPHAKGSTTVVETLPLFISRSLTLGIITYEALIDLLLLL